MPTGRNKDSDHSKGLIDGIRRIGALRTSNYVYINPVSTMVASALFLNEPMTPVAWVGSILILLGIYLANQSKGI